MKYQGESRENGDEAIFEEIMVENFPKLMKDMKLQIQSLLSPRQDKYKEKLPLRYITVELLGNQKQRKK